MSLFLDSIEHLNNPDLNSLDSIFMAIKANEAYSQPSFENGIFTMSHWDIIEHDLCHCLTFALDDKLERLRVKNFGYDKYNNIVSPLENAVEEYKVLSIHATLSDTIKKHWDAGDYHQVPSNILSSAYPSQLVYREHIYTLEPWEKELHPEFQPNLIAFNTIKSKLRTYSSDDVRTAVTKLKEYFL